MSIDSLRQKKLIWRAESPEIQKIQEQKSYRAGSSIPFACKDIDSFVKLHVGAIHEFCSPSGVPLMLFAVLAGNFLQTPTPHSKALRHIVWIGKESWPSPFLLRKTLPEEYLPKCIFLNPKNHKEYLWSIEHALRSPAVALSIGHLKKLSLSQSRRFALLAKKKKSILFLSKQELLSPSAASTRWSLLPAAFNEPSPSWQLILEKQKGFSTERNTWHIQLQETIKKYSLKSVTPHSFKEDAETISCHIPLQLAS